MRFSTQTLFCLFGLLLFSHSGVAQAPASPTNGGATVINRTQLQISWQDNSNNEDEFQVFVYANGQLGTNLGSVPANTTSVPITGLSGGESFQYAIFAFSATEGYSGGVLTPLTTMPDVVTRYGHEAIVGEAFFAELYTDEFDLQTSATVSSLPVGVTFTAATRTLSFTPTEPGNFTFDLEVNYLDGFALTETISIRTLPAASGPAESTTLPSPDYHPGAGVQSLDLDTYFEDPDCSRAVRMTYGLGAVDIILYEDATPATVANFLAYVNGVGQGSYDGAIIHRSVPGFVIQGGGYRPIGGSAFESVTDLAPVANEPGLENVRGRLSMAKLGGDPDSATNEWFVSLGDNRSNLDFQNGGFSVFGRVAGDGMTVVDAIAALPTSTYNSITVDGLSRAGLLSDCPMNATTAPATMEQDKLVTIVSAEEVAPLTYAILSNSDSSVATATIDGESLEVTPLAVGTCTIRLQVTDLDNNTIERDLGVDVGWTFSDWIAASGQTENTGPLDDVDGDRYNNLIEYTLFGDLVTPNATLASGSQVQFGLPTEKDHLAIAFSTRLGVDDMVIYVDAINELSANPVWSEIWNSTLGSGDAQVDSSLTGAESIDWVIRDTQAVEDNASRFMRVRVEALVE